MVHPPAPAVHAVVAAPGGGSPPSAPAAGGLRPRAAVLVDYSDAQIAALLLRGNIRLTSVGAGALALIPEFGFATALPQPKSATIMGFPIALTLGYFAPLGSSHLLLHAGIATFIGLVTPDRGSLDTSFGYFGRAGGAIYIAAGGTPRIPIGADVHFGDGSVGFRGYLGFTM